MLNCTAISDGFLFVEINVCLLLSMSFKMKLFAWIWNAQIFCVNKVFKQELFYGYAANFNNCDQTRTLCYADS